MKIHPSANLNNPQIHYFFETNTVVTIIRIFGVGFPSGLSTITVRSIVKLWLLNSFTCDNCKHLDIDQDERIPAFPTEKDGI